MNTNHMTGFKILITGQIKNTRKILQKKHRRKTNFACVSMPLLGLLVRLVGGGLGQRGVVGCFGGFGVRN